MLRPEYVVILATMMSFFGRCKILLSAPPYPFHAMLNMQVS